MSTKHTLRSMRADPRSTRRASPIRGLLGKIVDDVGRLIVNGTYPPGEALPTEPELMAELDISRTALREAVKILTAKGLLESRTRSGTRVRAREHWNLLDPTLLRLYCEVVEYGRFAQHFQDIRLIIEPEAAARAAEFRTRPQLARLEHAYRAMEAARDAKDWTPADLSFHEAILDATGNPFMRPLGALISAALETLIAHSFAVSRDPFQSLPAHRRVLEAIREHHASAARQRMRALLADTALSVSKSIRAQRAGFSARDHVTG